MNDSACYLARTLYNSLLDKRIAFILAERGYFVIFKKTVVLTLYRVPFHLVPLIFGGLF